MARLRNSTKNDQRELTFAQKLELMIGPLPERHAFRNDESRRRAFREHQSEIERMVPQHSWAWVKYAAGGFLPEEGMRVTVALKRLSVESPEERHGRQTTHA
jgi:hypothetical protein